MSATGAVPTSPAPLGRGAPTLARRAAAMLAPLALLLAALAGPPTADAGCSRQRALDPSVPTWEQVNGFALGDRPAEVEELDRFLLAVDAASERVASATLATTDQGRPVRYAIVSRPASLNRVETISRTLRELRRGRLGTRAARRLAGRVPAVAWLAGGVHGNEPSGSDAAARLLYELAARTDCDNVRRLERLMTVVVPVQNPDGRVAGTRVNGAGFDLNRDWFARTQPETEGKVALMRRLPPVVAVDAHEEASAAFFFPPNTDPVYHEVPTRALRAIGEVVSPAVARAFAARSIPFQTARTYDLFFVGFSDSASTTAFGAAGMTFEKGVDAPFASRVREQIVAQDATLRTTAQERGRLLAAWAAGWREARAEGAAGRLSPNRTMQPGAPVRVTVPRSPVAAYVLRADRSAAEVARLVERLRAFDVEVDRLTRPVRVRSLAPYGPGEAGPARLPAGTFWVPMAQGAKHWVQALLNRETYAPFPYFSDVSAWSNPLLMGLEGGAVGDRRRPAGMRGVDGEPRLGRVPASAAPAYAVRTDSTGAMALVADLLRDGAAVQRAARAFVDGGTPFAAGTAVLPGSVSLARLRELAEVHQTPVAALSGTPEGVRPLAPVRVAVLGDLAPPARASSPGWARWVLERRLGLEAQTLSAADLEADRLDGSFTALVVADGELSAGALSVNALVRIAAWVRAGGAYVGVRSRGVAIARAAGLTSEEATDGPSGLRVPGAIFALVAAPDAPLAWGFGEAAVTAFNAGDPVLTGPAPAALRYPSGGSPISGYVEGAAGLGGTAAATDEAVGAGRVLLLAFDPAFRGYAEAGQRVLANAVLYPRPAQPAAQGGGPRRRSPAAGRGEARGTGAARAAGAPPRARVRPSELGDAAGAQPTVVRVTPRDAEALRTAARAAGVPPAATLARTAHGLELRIPNPTGAPPEARPWARPVAEALAARGILPTLVVA